MVWFDHHLYAVVLWLQTDERDTFASGIAWTKTLVAYRSVIDVHAIANRPPVSCAEQPKAKLNLSRKTSRILTVEFASVDTSRKTNEDVGTSAPSVTELSI